MDVSRRGILAALGGAAVAAAWPHAGQAAPLARVKEQGVLRVAVYRDNRPWSAQMDGRLGGIDVDLAQAIADRLGVRLDAAELTADEDVSDDLRNAVWRGGLLGFLPCDLMMHVPYDRVFAGRNDQVAIVAPYYRESFGIACGAEVDDCEAPPAQFKGQRLAVEIDSIPDFYFLGAFGGVLKQDVVHFPSGVEAVAAVADSKADVTMATRAQLETVMAQRPGSPLRRRKGPLPAAPSPGWDIGMAVKENSRSLGDAVDEIVTALAASGELKAMFARHGVTWTPPVAA